MTPTITKRAAQRHTLVALASVAAAAALAAPAGAAPLTVTSGSLEWSVPRSTAPYTLAGYSASIGAGSVDASGAATGASVTPTSLPAAGTGVYYPYSFPAVTGGTFDPVAKTGSINFSGTLTFTAHGGTFLSVVNPTIQFDVPQSARIVANGVVSPAQGSADPTPVSYGTTAARQTVFALNAASVTAVSNPDGSYTFNGLLPSGTPTAAPTSFISSNTVFDGVRTFFGLERPNQSFSFTVAGTPVATATPTPTPTATPTATPTPAPTGTPAATPTPAPTATPTPAPTPTPTPATGSTQNLTVTGSVGGALNLTLNSTTANLGTFLPGVAANYDASVTGTATSTGPAVLSVQDQGTTPGFLVNGTKSLAAPLLVKATNATTPTSAYTALSGNVQSLLSFDAGTATPLTIGLRQPIAVGDALSAGTYGKTLTFTLSAGV